MALLVMGDLWIIEWGEMLPFEEGKDVSEEEEEIYRWLWWQSIGEEEEDFLLDDRDKDDKSLSIREKSSSSSIPPPPMSDSKSFCSKSSIAKRDKTSFSRLELSLRVDVIELMSCFTYLIRSNRCVRHFIEFIFFKRHSFMDTNLVTIKKGSSESVICMYIWYNSIEWFYINEKL